MVSVFCLLLRKGLSDALNRSTHYIPLLMDSALIYFEFMMINWPPPAPVTSTTLPSKVKGADIFRWCMFLCLWCMFLCLWGDIVTLKVCGWISRETLRRDFYPTSANGAVTSPSSGQSDPRAFTPPGGTWLLFVRVMFILMNNAEYKQCHSWCLSCQWES